jgi:hypothetical protein
MFKLVLLTEKAWAQRFRTHPKEVCYNVIFLTSRMLVIWFDLLTQLIMLWLLVMVRYILILVVCLSHINCWCFCFLHELHWRYLRCNNLFFAAYYNLFLIWLIAWLSLLNLTFESCGTDYVNVSSSNCRRVGFVKCLCLC